MGRLTPVKGSLDLEKTFKKGKIVERIFDDGTKLGLISKKRYVEAKTGVIDAGRLRLIVCKGHRQNNDNNRLVDEIVRKQTQGLLLSPDAIIIRRFSSGRIVFWNGGAHRLYGWSKKEAIGRIVYNLLETELPEVPRDIKAHLRRHGYWSGELVQTRKEGTKIIVASHWSLRQSLNGGPIEILEINYNLSDKRQSREKARQSERLALLGTMTAVFAHEVANPLTGISASLQFLQHELETKKLGDVFLRETVLGATREIDRLSSLLNDFRSLTLPQSLDLRLTDLATIIRDVLAVAEMTYRTAGITVKLEVDGSLPAIELDSAKMKQVIWNLCKNAAEAMQNGGRLAVKVYPNGHSVLLEISDEGSGVPKGVNIFELFKTTKPGGTGLGLSVARNIVSAHNGTINYRSDAGRGTTFTIRLPAAT